MKRNGEANPYSNRPKESAHEGHHPPSNNTTMHHTNLDSIQDCSSSHGYQAHQPSHHTSLIRNQPSSYPHPHPAINNSHLPLPPPPPGPPPPVHVQSILKNTSPARQPRSKLFQRFAHDRPQPQEKQRRSKLFQRSSLTLQLKPPPPPLPLPPPQPHVTQHPEQLSQLTSKRSIDHDDHGAVANDDRQPENASSKPKAFQSQDQALKALKQRRRAKAVEAWKGTIADGEVGKKDDTISEAVLDAPQDTQQTSRAGTKGGMNGGANGQAARTTQGGTIETSNEKEEGGGNALSSTSINWTGEDDLSEEGEVVDDSMSMSESDEEDTRKKSTKSDTHNTNTNTKDTSDTNIQVRGPVTKEHEQDAKQASIHPSPMRIVMQEESKEATTNDSDLVDTDDEAQGDHSAIQEPTELKRAQSNPSIPPVHIPPLRLVNKQPPKEGALSTQSSRDDDTNSGEKPTGLIRARSNPVQRSKEHLKRAQNAMGEIQQKSKKSIVPEAVSERTESDSHNNKANIDSIKRLRKMSRASLSKLSSIKRKSSEETAEVDDSAMGEIAELEASEQAPRGRNKSSKKRKRQKGLSFDLTQSFSATVANAETELLSEGLDKKDSLKKKRKKGDSSKLSRSRMLLEWHNESIDVDAGIASRNDVSGFGAAVKGSTKSHSSRSNSPIPSDAEKVEPATTRRKRSTRSEHKETTDKQASKVLPAKIDQKSSKKARRKTHSRVNVTAGANEATIINSNNSSKQSVEQKQNNLSAARKPRPNEVPYKDKDGYTNSIVHPKSLSEHNVDESMPLMDLWRKERRKKKKSGKTTRLFLSNGAAASDNANICNGNRRKTKKRRQLFRHRLVLPEFCSPGAPNNVNSAGGDWGNEGGCDQHQQQPEQKVQAKVAAQKVLAFQYNDSLWDHSWDDESDEEDDTKVDIDVVDLLQVSSRKLPFSDTPVLNPPISDEAAASKSKSAKDSSGKEVPSRLLSLRERIEKADAAIQSKAPSSIEFGAKSWIDKTTASSSVARGSDNSDTRDSAQRLPNQQGNATFIRRDQQSFFSIPPRAKPYTSSNSAQEFITLLHSMASEAVAACGLSPASSANAVVMEFLTIVRESRVNPPQTPFHLMKQVWELILTIAPGCSKDGASGQTNELAAKFDAFLPEGYSMVSSNLLILENIQRANRKMSQAEGGEGECARTHKPFIGSLKTG